MTKREKAPPSKEGERKKDNREVKRGTDTGQQGYEDRVG